MAKSNQKNQTKAVADLVDIVVRYRWRLILPAFAVTALVLAASLLLPRKYKAEAIFERHTRMALEQIIARGAPESMPMPRHTLTEEVAGQTAVDELIRKIEPQIMRSSIARNGSYDSRDLREKLNKEVVVKPILSTKTLDRVSVSYIADDPKLAQITVNTLIRNYIDRTHAKMQQRLGQTARFFEKEVNRAKHTIEELENQRLAFQIEHAELLPENTNNVQMTVARLQAELSLLHQQREAAHLRARKLQERLEETPERQSLDVTAKNPELDELEKKQRSLKDQIDVYIQQYGMTEKHPDLISLRAQVAAISKAVAVTSKTVVTEQHLSNNPKHRELDVLLTSTSAEAEALDRQVAIIEQQIAQHQSQSSQLFPVRRDYSKLERQIEETHRQLAFWEDNLRHIGLTQAAEADNRGIRLEFVKPCTEINRPVSPNLVQVLLASVALGVVAGGVSVFSAYRTDEVILDGDQLVESFGLPLFGSVSEIISRQQRRARRIRNTFIYPSGALAMICVLVTMASMLYVSLEQPALSSKADEILQAPQPAQQPLSGAETNRREERPDV